MKFQELLEIIKKYQGGTDYNYSSKVGGKSSPAVNTSTYSQETYGIFSPELKKEAHKTVIPNGDVGDCEICRVGMNISEKWYEYEKGDGSQPDKFTIKDITPDEKSKEKEQRDREQAQRDREQAERDRRQAERDREAERRRKEKSPGTFDDKKECAGCGKELDPTAKREISMGPVGSKEGRIYFCPFSDCSAKFFREKDQKRENKQNDNSPWGKKCAGCDNIIDCEFIGGDNEGGYYCSVECANKNHKPKSEVEKIQDKLQNLKSKLENSSDPTEKENLKQEIDKLERKLGNQQNQNNSKNPQKGYGVIIAWEVIIFAIFALGWLVIARKKKSKIS